MMGMVTTVVLKDLTDAGIEDWHGHIVGVYRRAFGAPPYNKGEVEVTGFAQSLPEHVRREGFRFVAAFEGENESMVGFAYGYISKPGQFWYDTVATALGPHAAAEWLTRSFQLAEIAVAPHAQGRGIGSRLHDRLLEGIALRKAVLSTMRAKTAAQRLYRKRGWVTLLDQLRFPGVGRAYRIMGLDLEHRGICGSDTTDSRQDNRAMLRGGENGLR
jgi:ribosomal protein S18 acetylase RimI-like enzyme